MLNKNVNFIGLVMCVIAIAGLTGCKKANEALNQKPVCAFINYVDQVQILKEDSITV